MLEVQKIIILGVKNILLTDSFSLKLEEKSLIPLRSLTLSQHKSTAYSLGQATRNLFLEFIIQIETSLSAKLLRVARILKIWIQHMEDIILKVQFNINLSQFI